MQTYKINYTRVIGSGQFGIIYASSCLEYKENVCAKVITSNYFKQSLQNEKDIMNYLRKQEHPNIVRILDVDQVEEDSQMKTIIYMEYCRNGNLQQELEKNFTEFDIYYVLNIMKQIINGMKFLHDKKIIHRDLKPANILLDGGIFKITDFGTSRFVLDREFILKSRTGSPAYASPQILDYQQYTSKTDIYSIGIIFYQLLFNMFPFGDRISYQIIQDFHQRIKNTPFQCPEINMNGKDQDKQELRELINQMIQYQESDRIDLHQIFQYQNLLNSYYNYKDQQHLEYNEVLSTNDQINLLQSLKAEESIPQLLYSKQFIQDQAYDSQIQLLESQNFQQISGNFDDVFINRHTKQGLEFNLELNLQNLTKGEKIAHVIQMFIEKCNVAWEVSQIIKNLHLKEIDQVQIKGLIVALDGYSINLLQTALGFAHNELELLQSVLRDYNEENITNAIKEFQQNKTPQYEELKKKIQKQINALYPKIYFDYGQFIQLSDQYPEDRLNGLRNLILQDSPNTSINGAYTIYMQWINYFYSVLPFQKQAKIQLVNDPKYILQKNLKYVLDLENKYHFVNIFQQKPDSIRIKKLLGH